MIPRQRLQELAMFVGDPAPQSVLETAAGTVFKYEAARWAIQARSKKAAHKLVLVPTAAVKRKNVVQRVCDF
jgi:hypothetical protein